MMKNYRMDQVNELLQREIGTILLERVADPRARKVTLTGARTARDLQHARIYFSVLDPEALEETLECLRGAAGFIRRELGTRVRLKYTPELEFVYDPSQSRGARILSMLREMREKGELQDAPPDNVETEETDKE